MNKGIAMLGSFLFGGGVGYFLHKVLKDREYEERIDEEVASVKEAFRKAREAEKKETEEEKKPEPEEKKPVKENRTYGSAPKGPEVEKEREEYNKVLNRTGYRPHEMEKTEETLHKMAKAIKNRPTVIDPALIGAKEEYDEDPVEFTYYADGTLCNDEGKPLSDIEIDQSVGSDFASHFGEYEDDSVAVDNPMLKLYFLVLRDLRTYEQAKGQSKPFVRE